MFKLKSGKMETTFMKMVLGVIISTALFTSCKKDTVEENEEEVITTMQLSFVPVGGGIILTYQYDDADGPGGAAPTQSEIILAPFKTYNVTLQLLNKTATPVADITTEVKAESDAHRFYYEPAAGSNIAVTGLDNDGNGVPLGITSQWATGATATGKIKVTLRHYPAVPPNKLAADLVNSSKSGTDIEVEFNTKIQ
jgi:hypothetical protein